MKTQSTRALTIRARRADRVAARPTCPTHGHTVKLVTCGQVPRFVCGCIVRTP